MFLFQYIIIFIYMFSNGNKITLREKRSTPSYPIEQRCDKNNKKIRNKS